MEVLGAGALAQTSFTSRSDSSRLLLERLGPQIDSDKAYRLLDLGCGTGTFVRLAAEQWAKLTAVGVDFSARNIQIASQEIKDTLSERVSFVCGDYLKWNGDKVDGITSESVLHLIPCSDEQLAAKLARDLKAGGQLLFTMPYESRSNRALIKLRSGLARVRSAGLDNLALYSARWVHPSWKQDELKERLEYLYLVPARVYAAPFEASLIKAGLQKVGEWDWPRTSPAKLAHRCYLFLKQH